MRIDVLPVNPEDVDGIARLAQKTWGVAYAGIISRAQMDYMLAERYAPDRLREELSRQDIWWDKGLAEGELAAFASTHRTATAGEIKLDKLYVDPRRQRLGLGGYLVRHVVERARKGGFDTLILAVNKRNTQAISAYEKYGFAIRESVCVDIGSGFVMDDFIMSISLR